MNDTETIQLPYFLSKKIILFENIQNGYIVDFNKSVDNQLDWLNTQKSVIDNLLNSTEFNIIHKQITENIEPIDLTISNNLKALSLNSQSTNKFDINNNLIHNEDTKDNNNSQLKDDINDEIFEERPPSLLDFTKNITDIEKTIILDNKNESNNDKSKLSLSSFQDFKEKIENHNFNKENLLKSDITKNLSNLKDLKDKVENRNLIINKIENKNIFKKLNDKTERLTEPSSPDVITDFKRSLSNYAARKKKSTLLSINDTIDSSTTVKNNIETTKLSSPPLLNLEDDTLTSSLNNNIIDVSNLNNENENNNDNDLEMNKIENLNKQEKKVSTLIDEVEMLYKSYSPIRNKNNNSHKELNELKELSKVGDILKSFNTPIKSKSISENLNKKLDELKDYDKTEELSNALTPVKSKSVSDIFNKKLNEIDSQISNKDNTEKNDKTEKQSTNFSTFSVLTSPFTPFSHEKKSRITTTPDKKKLNNANESSKKSVSERFKAIWDSTTKGLHYAFSRSISSDNKEKKNTNTNTNTNANTNSGVSLSPSIKLYYSPERDPELSAFAAKSKSKSTNFKSERMVDKTLNMKPIPSSIPSKTSKVNLFNSNFDDLNIDFKDDNTMSFLTAVQSPSDSPLALKSKGFPINIDNINNNNKGKEFNLLKKSTSDLTENNNHKKNYIEKESTSMMRNSWNNSIYDINLTSNREQPSLIPKNLKLKNNSNNNSNNNNNNLKKAKSKIKSLESAKLIKKHEELLTKEKKQKIKMNAERHMLYLQKKKKEEEEKIANMKQKEEERKLKSEKYTQQKQLEMEVLIKKRNEKIKQVNERKKALKNKEVVKKNILYNNSNLYKTSLHSSVLDKYKNTSSVLDTNALLKQKNSNSRNSIKKSVSNLSQVGSKKSSLTSILPSNIKKSSIPKPKSTTTITEKSKSTLSSSNSNRNSNSNSNSNNNPISISSSSATSSANVSIGNILSGLNNQPPPSKPIILGLNNFDESSKKNKTSITSISSSRSSSTPYKGTILQDGEFPDIPSDYSDEEDSRSSLIATWAKTPNLLKELERQKDINPDDIFGGYRPCHLDEIFKGSHFKRHTVNENWADSSILHDDES
ncbi:hypothetical protein BCR32DRAFT_279744 [Anaeromyces robustus]|uniref:Inner centromere protein ARK-binding domain-containing protein n=1 Tax=Anaeromyces robustus TaxID=1754192 RepID=A0A1Y1X6N4_9FUNG|nr:hypothetical protein BCR32DRAFT_279744 [Anaeromyces robustus]|eukprot:ORX81443.1 hypothetical protein BCR32DRAFT_279744 [Anaeromyces robustus]